MAKIIKSSQTDADRCFEYERATLEEMVTSGLAADETLVSPAEILSRAREEAEQKVQEAYAEGLRKGTEAGKAKFEEGVAESGTALKNAADAIQQAREAYLTSLEPEVVELAVCVAERILRREARTDRELVTSTVKAALTRLTDGGTVVLHVNPADLEALRTQKVTLLDEFDAVEQLELIADDTVDPGGCVAQSSALHIDARLEAQLEQILDELLE